MVKKYEEQIEKLKKDVSEEYERRRIIPQILSLDKIKIVQETGGFSKIGLHPSVENKWFLFEDHINDFGFFSSDIPNGEIRYFSSKIFEKKKEIIKLEDKDFSAFKEKILNLRQEKSVILIEIVNFHNLLESFQRELEIKYNSQTSCFTILNIPVIRCLSEDLEGKIILLDKDCGIWYYKKSDNSHSNKLFIETHRYVNKTSFEIYVSVKCDILNENKLEIIEFYNKKI